jgi:hypothetical protein
VVDKTGDETLDFVLGAGPRAITPDLPEHVIKEVAKRPSLREAMRRMKLEEREQLEAEIVYVCRMNRIKEELMQATPWGCPDACIPISLINALEAQEKDSWNPEMREDTLKCYPGLRLNVKRGMHGQQYVRGR